MTTDPADNGENHDGLYAPYDLTSRTLMGLYAIDDTADALAAIVDVNILAATAIVDLAAWFPADIDTLSLPADTYTYAAQRTLHTQLTFLGRLDETHLQTISKTFTGPAASDTGRLGFGLLNSPIGDATILATITDNPATDPVTALVAIGTSGGPLDHLLRIALPSTDRSADPPAGHRPDLDPPISDLCRTIIRYCCGHSSDS